MNLVTGGAGFIGSHIAQRLVSDGRRVRILDNFSSGKLSNLEAFIDEVELIEGDIRDASIVKDAMRDVDVVFHQAAIASVPASVADPVTCYDVNVTGTLNLLLAARDAGVRRFVLASTSAVYGDAPEMPKVESMPPQPLSPYASSKLAAEDLCKVFDRAFGVEAVALRYFNIFGPRQDPASEYAAVIPKFIESLNSDQAPTIFGDGEQTRDFLFIDNVVDANLRAASADRVGGQVFNIASGTSVSVNDMYYRLAELLNKRLDPGYGPARAGDVRDSLADINAARNCLGYSAKVSFADGLTRTVDAFS